MSVAMANRAALALMGFMLAVIGATGNYKGGTLALLDLFAALLALYGMILYQMESKSPENRVLDQFSVYGEIVESLVSFGSLPVIGAQIGIHQAKGDYNG